MVEIRMVLPSDAENILEIYAPYIKHSFCTFESEVPTVEQIRERIQKVLESKPWIVCVIDKKLAGYVYASAHRDRAAYQWSCECSVYTKTDFQGIGIGHQLYKVLFQMLKTLGYRNVYAGITLPNEASARLHEKHGFTHFATYENVGYKLGHWKDVGWWKLQLNNYNPKPSPPIKLSETDVSRFDRLFSVAADHILQKLTY
jgi:L-amino acid N-acyltransferase YncA